MKTVQSLTNEMRVTLSRQKVVCKGHRLLCFEFKEGNHSFDIDDMLKIHRVCLSCRCMSCIWRSPTVIDYVVLVVCYSDLLTKCMFKLEEK